ncbi:hypothetical protein O181_042806 [Austropuccinia psidii MF-1]|uniref:Nitronate monooxygenase domain-containing protein n=1 Tax=Austropuccinia psidii MF-1 TaxID=1389203 RepID=A0A9Q3DMA9_9BASI|nr:hypothetical protein [Austropuccinia psidii MF-1]
MDLFLSSSVKPLLKLTTPLTNCLQSHLPIISAPMAGISGLELATEVSLAGGFGFVGLGYETLEHLDQEIIDIRKKFSHLSFDQLLPIGYGFLVWRLEEEEENLGIEKIEEYFFKLISQIRCIWLSFGNNLARWIRLLNRLNASSSKSEKCKIAIQVTNVREAEELLNDHQSFFDILVVQGSEAGGHGLSTGTPINAILPEILGLLRSLNNSSKSQPIIVAAGGLVNGNHLAAMLALGATGIVCGTRFLATPEAKYSNQQKANIIASKSQDSFRTDLFDILRGTTGWPSGIDGRALRNQTVVDYENGVDIDVLKAKYTEAVKKGDASRVVTWCGASGGSVTNIKPAQHIVQEMAEEAIMAIKNLATLLG